MSMQVSDEQRSYIWSFAAPTALNTPVIGVEETSQERSITPLAEIDMVDAFLEVEAANGLRYRFFVRRPGSKMDTLFGTQSTLRPEVNYERRPGLPLGLAAGQFQMVMVQVAGALTAQTVQIIFNQELTV